MNIPRKPLLLSVAAVGALVVIAVVVARVQAADDKKPAAAASAPKAALTVTTTTPQSANLPVKLSANGSIAAWQEASVGTEANGLRLAEVRVNVGDVVKRGQVLASFAPDTVQVDLNQTRASVAEAEATLAEAAANAQRARELQTSGALSEQQINQYLTAERTARARLDWQRAAARVQELRLRQTQVLAPDNGIISARSATVGAVLPAGQELFRLIRQGRLEWRAEVAAADLTRLKPGMSVQLSTAGGATIAGKLRMVAPTIDAQTRNGIVYVDLSPSPEARAGMFARGEFEIGSGQGLTLPQSAVLLRDGFSYVLRVGPDSKVAEAKVTVGRRVGDRIEITGGLAPDARVVASGGGFLTDGDLVRVVDAAAAKASTRTAANVAGSAAATATK
ncbi:efflux RND transporter periplasmic adaptor subunit [Piscinibacter sp.]|uniref:efflux RND transporter periplasmic adaptor subunit n=1 Tax=Piscinibacter sp. TaxID=1903157 RepID=UPI003559C7B3